MNIQKVGVLLAMSAILSASKAKSETTSPDVRRDVLNNRLSVPFQQGI